MHPEAEIGADGLTGATHGHKHRHTIFIVRPVKLKGCLAYYIENTQQTNIHVYDNESMSSPDVRGFLLTAVKLHKLSGFGLICRHDLLTRRQQTIVLQEREEGGRHIGIPWKSWKDNIK